MAFSIIDMSGRMMAMPTWGRPYSSLPPLQSTQGLVIHHTAERGSVQDIMNTFAQRGTVAQFVMDRNGQVYQMTPNGSSGWQIATGHDPHYNNLNTIGIEVIAKDNNDWTPAQKAAIPQFYHYLKTDPTAVANWGAQNLDTKHVFGHGDLDKIDKEPSEGQTGVAAIRAAYPASGQPGPRAVPAPNARAIPAPGSFPLVGAAPGHSPNLQQVDPRLVEAVSAGAAQLPAGYKATITEGYNPSGHVPLSQHHIAGRGAVDVQITDPNGNVIPREGNDPTGMYQRLAQGAYGYTLANHPELTGKLAWGGSFATTNAPGNTTRDLMHFDIGGERGKLFPTLSKLGPLAPGTAPSRLPPASIPNPPDKAGLLKTLFNAESYGGRNVPNVTDPGPGAGGGYFQIKDATWARYAQRVGVDTSAYPTAMKAPYSVQAQVAAAIPMGQWGSRTLNLIRGAGYNLNLKQTLGENLANNGEPLNPNAGPPLTAYADQPQQTPAQQAIQNLTNPPGGTSVAPVSPRDYALGRFGPAPGGPPSPAPGSVPAPVAAHVADELAGVISPRTGLPRTPVPALGPGTTPADTGPAGTTSSAAPGGVPAAPSAPAAPYGQMVPGYVQTTPYGQVKRGSAAEFNAIFNRPPAHPSGYTYHGDDISSGIDPALIAGSEGGIPSTPADPAAALSWGGNPWAPGTSGAPAAAAGAAGYDPRQAPVRNLTVGMSGEDVRRVQNQLRALGFNPGAADGVYGPQTRAAVLRAQKAVDPKGYAGPNDGIAGVWTQGMLQRLAPPPTPPMRPVPTDMLMPGGVPSDITPYSPPGPPPPSLALGPTPKNPVTGQPRSYVPSAQPSPSSTAGGALAASDPYLTIAPSPPGAPPKATNSEILKAMGGTGPMPTPRYRFALPTGPVDPAAAQTPAPAAGAAANGVPPRSMMAGLIGPLPNPAADTPGGGQNRLPGSEQPPGYGRVPYHGIYPGSGFFPVRPPEAVPDIQTPDPQLQPRITDPRSFGYRPTLAQNPAAAVQLASMSALSPGVASRGAVPVPPRISPDGGRTYYYNPGMDSGLGAGEYYHPPRPPPAFVPPSQSPDYSPPPGYQPEPAGRLPDGSLSPPGTDPRLQDITPWSRPIGPRPDPGTAAPFNPRPGTPGFHYPTEEAMASPTGGALGNILSGLFGVSPAEAAEAPAARPAIPPAVPAPPAAAAAAPSGGPAPVAPAATSVNPFDAAANAPAGAAAVPGRASSGVVIVPATALPSAAGTVTPVALHPYDAVTGAGGGFNPATGQYTPSGGPPSGGPPTPPAPTYRVNTVPAHLVPRPPFTQAQLNSVIGGGAGSLLGPIGSIVGALLGRGLAGGAASVGTPYQGARSADYGLASGTSSWGTPTYTAPGSAYSNSPFTPAGWTAPSFDTISGGPTYAYHRDPNTGTLSWINSAGNVVTADSTSTTGAGAY